MGKCNFPTKNGTPCEREVGGCYQHQPKRVSKPKSNKDRMAFTWLFGGLATVVTLVSGIFEYPHVKLPFFSQTATTIASPPSATDLHVVIDATPSPQIQTDKTLTANRISPPLAISPSEQLLTTDLVTAKIGNPLASNILVTQQVPGLDSATTVNVSQPSNALPGIVGQLSLPQFVGLTENHLTIDSVTATVDRQSALNILGSQASSMLTPNWLKAKEIPSLTASNSLTESDKALPVWLKAQENPTLTPSASLTDSLPDWLKAQLQSPTLASFPSTAAHPTASGLLGVQQFPSINSLTGSQDGHVIPSNAVAQ